MVRPTLGGGPHPREHEPAASALPPVAPQSISGQTPTTPGRFSGQSVVEELLRQHEDRPTRSRLARAFGASPLDSNGLSWLRAAQAEMIVGDILDRLPGNYSVYHSLPIPNTAFAVDHLVVGPGGVFSVNAKNHWDRDLAGSPRSLPIGGYPMPYLRDVAFESAQITTLLATELPPLTAVRPVIALVNPHKIRLARKPDSVTVIDSPRLRRWIAGQPRTITPEQQLAIVALVDDPATWSTKNQLLAPLHVHARFTALEQQVAAARTRRVTFAVCAAAAVATVVGLVASPMIVAMGEFIAAL